MNEYLVTFRWPHSAKRIIRADSLSEAQDKAFARFGPYTVIMVQERRSA